MDHPMIKEIERTGLPIDYQGPIGRDSLGNVLYQGDIVYEYNDELFLVDELFYETRQVLEKIGAEKKEI